MKTENKIKLIGVVFLALLLFTVPGREVLGEVLGMVIGIGIAGIIMTLLILGWESLKELFKKKDAPARNTYKSNK